MLKCNKKNEKVFNIKNLDVAEVYHENLEFKYTSGNTLDKIEGRLLEKYKNIQIDTVTIITHESFKTLTPPPFWVSMILLV